MICSTIEKIEAFQMARRMTKAMDIPEDSKLQEVTRKLEEILRIQDWDITVKAASSTELDKNGGSWDDEGNVYIDYTHKCADICVSKESIDWYKTLLHELFHIQDAGYHQYLNGKYDIGNDSVCTNIEEQRINELAKMFVRIYPLERLEKEGTTDGEEKGN